MQNKDKLLTISDLRKNKCSICSNIIIINKFVANIDYICKKCSRNNINSYKIIFGNPKK